ncbi:hypothetical protein MKZ17_12445 [Solibacillus sp. FSL R7-0682]|uniref:hypothetical protein n=1 Tax=Solibacillus sp. FSL R7-0682 TaxID=2921690 RepID=UPI0030F55AC4
MNHDQLLIEAFSAEKLLFDTLSLNHQYQHFFYFNDEGDLKTTNEKWPELKKFDKSGKLEILAYDLLLNLVKLAKFKRKIQLKRGEVYTNSRLITKSSAKNLNTLLQYLYDKNYVILQKNARQRYIVVNPLACKFFS